VCVRGGGGGGKRGVLTAETVSMCGGCGVVAGFCFAVTGFGVRNIAFHILYIKVMGVHTVVLVINTGNKGSVKTQLISLLDYVLSNNNNSNNNTYITTCFGSYKELRKTSNYIYGLAKQDPIWCLQYEFST
jgi:hypothetical protein